MFVCSTASAISQGKGGRVNLEEKKLDEKIIDITKIYQRKYYKMWH